MTRSSSVRPSGRRDVDRNSSFHIASADTDEAACCHFGPSGIGPGIPVGFQAKDNITPGTISGQLDNALSVAIAVELIRNGFNGTVLFTAGEEAGISWKALADWFDGPTDRSVARAVANKFPGL